MGWKRAERQLFMDIVSSVMTAHLCPALLQPAHCASLVLWQWRMLLLL